MPHQKIKELYYGCNLVTSGTPIQHHIHIIYTNIINYVWFFCKLHFSCVWQLHYNQCKCNTQLANMLQPMYNIHTYNHAMCIHFPCALDMTLGTSNQLWFPLIQLFVPLFCHYATIIKKLIFHYFVIVVQLLII
jgi:hypothetical protein